MPAACLATIKFITAIMNFFPGKLISFLALFLEGKKFLPFLIIVAS
jgi:hypothetical protein